MSLENAPAVVLPDKAPAYALAMLQKYGIAAPINDIAVIGIGAGMPPTIGCNGTRFQRTENGETTIIQRLTIDVVILAAKDAMTKRYYASAYNPNAEAEAPDCYSLDGVRPCADAKNKQADVCATCPMNQFGSGKDAQGNPSKGKACGDRKVLAIFAAGKPYNFEITPAALKNFGTYVRQELNPRGLDLRTVITTIGFAEDSSFPQYTFKFGGLVPEEQLPSILEWIGSPEVKAIVEPAGSVAVAALPQTTQVQQNVLPEVVKEVAKEVIAEAVVDDGFGSLGGGTGTQVQQTAAKTTRQTKAKTETAAASTAATAAPTNSDLANALGLDL